MKLKSKALKERTKVSGPLKAFTVYPLNTPAALVPRVLPIKSQVKIHIFTLIQLFSKFDQTCKKRITPSAITDGERGFEQTKACYLQEVIPFFKTLKDNFEGIQKALTKEVKETKDVFEELEAEVAQYAVDRKHDAIKLKNLLIANDNLIVECLSQDVFCVATNSELNVARFTEMLAANTTAETRCLALEAELANLCKTNNQDNQKELINHFSKLEVSHLNLQLKYQNLKDKIGNSPPTPDKDTPYFDSVFVISKMQASLQGKDNVIRQLKKQLSQMQVTRRNTDRALQVQTTDSQITKNNMNAHLDYLRYLKESVETIRDILEEAKVVRPLDRSIVSACRYTKHSQELLEYAIGTCPQGSQPRAKQPAHIPLIRKKQLIVAQPSNKLDSTTHLHVVTVISQKTNFPVPPSTGVNSCPIASESQPKSHVKPNKISPAKGDNKLPVDDQPRKNKSYLITSNQMLAANTTAETRCLALKAELANVHETNNQDNQKELINYFSKLELQVTRRDTDRALQVQTTDSQITKLTDQVTHLQAQNDLFRAENEKIKQHYKELYDSIKIARAKHIKQVTKLTTENMNLKTSVSKATVNPLVSARDKHAIDVEPIVHRLRNNRNAHLDYLRHLKENVETIRDIVEEAKVVRPLDRSIVSACRYTKHSQELLKYAIDTCPQGSQPHAK
nr:hypothetical protein [Tanacetum cinerariifolium]